MCLTGSTSRPVCSPVFATFLPPRRPRSIRAGAGALCFVWGLVVRPFLPLDSAEADLFVRKDGRGRGHASQLVNTSDSPPHKQVNRDLDLSTRLPFSMRGSSGSFAGMSVFEAITVTVGPSVVFRTTIAAIAKAATRVIPRARRLGTRQPSNWGAIDHASPPRSTT
jgi:hypothetical protein